MLEIKLSATPALESLMERFLDALESGDTKSAKKVTEKKAPMVEEDEEEDEPAPKKKTVKKPAVEEDEEDDAPKKPVKTKVTLETVRAAVQEKTSTHRPQIKKLLAFYETDSVSELDKTYYAEFLAKVEAL